MKNYYDTKHELELIKLRLEVLHGNKESLQMLVDPKSVVTDRIIVDCGEKPPDQNIVNYVHLMEKVTKEIEVKTLESMKLQEKLKIMEKYLREIKDVKYKVFVMRYIDNLSVIKIAQRLNYSERRIYQLLKKIGINI